ncbi:hypothetical protein [Microcoleus sp. herbarium14]|uniref:hypothetical protein n=1 Tax=Microcoleus sp. herbarium14 TaxID=3055439 RepID=UPI002FD23920
MSSKLIGSMAATICCAGLALIPMPFRQWANLRVAGAAGALSFSIAGCCIGDRQKRKQLAYDRWHFDQQQEQRLIAEATRPIAIQTAVTKLQTQAEYALADHKDDVSAAYTAVMIDKYGEDWIRSQLPQPEPEQVALPEPELAAIVEEIKQKDESFAAKKAKLLKFINEHEGGWILQCMQKPLLIYGDMGAFKSYFAEFLALCRIYLKGHQVISIADPHFHQNKDEAWKCLVALGVPGYGANQNYQTVGEQLNAMYLRFATRTLKDAPVTSIWDEVTGYGSEEGTAEPAKKLIRKIISDPRKANEAPILIGHDNTLIALGGSEGFSKSRDRGIIQLELYSDSDNRPLFKGKISGIKSAEGEFLEAQNVSIAPEWIRSSWVYDLFNSAPETETIPETTPETTPETETIPETNSAKFDRILGISEDYWLAESDPEMLDRLKQQWLSELGNSPDNQPDNAQDKSDNLDAELSRSDNLISSEIMPEPLPREIYPLIWDSEDFARLLPNESESAFFEKILELSDKYKSASKIIQQGLGFTQRKGKPKSYSDVGKPGFKYIVMKCGTPSLIAKFKDYLERD